METINDTYMEHEQHIIGKSGKIVPFFRNMKTCSTCYSEHKKIIDRQKTTVLSGSGWDYEINDYKIV